jgi:hypothetical protein
VVFKKVSARVSSESDTRSRKLTTTVITVVMIALVCWTPAVIVYLIPPDPVQMNQTNLRLNQVAFLLMVVASYLNNIIYPMKHPGYRRAYRALLACRDKRQVGVELSDSKAQNTNKTNVPLTIMN